MIRLPKKRSAWLSAVLLFLCFAIEASYGEEKRKCRLEVLVTHGDRNDLGETEKLDSSGLVLAPCVVLVRRWSKESIAEKLGGGNLGLKQEPDDDRVARFQFKRKTPLNFAVVNHNEAFVLDFSESDKRWAVIPTLIDKASLTQRTKEGMTSAGFFCNVKGGVHDVVCLNTDGAVIGYIFAVPKFAEEYQVVSNGETIELEFGRVDVSVWLGRGWHPMRYSGTITQDDLKLHFMHRHGNEGGHGDSGGDLGSEHFSGG